MCLKLLAVKLEGGGSDTEAWLRMTNGSNCFYKITVATHREMSHSKICGKKLAAEQQRVCRGKSWQMMEKKNKIPLLDS